jgi:DNA-binding transcriptional LysR family regulator
LINLSLAIVVKINRVASNFHIFLVIAWFMDISVLQIFIEVMRQGSFAAVARERNVDPSSVSRAIASLEQELGVKLLQRTTRQISATEAGMTYFNRIEPLVEELEQAVELVSDISGSPKGNTIISSAIALKQCALSGMGLALLPHWLIDPELQSGKLVKVLTEYEVTATDFNTSAWLIYPSRNYVPLKVRLFIDFLKQHVVN